MFRRLLLMLIVVVGTMYFFMLMYIHQHPLQLQRYDRVLNIPSVKWCKKMRFQIPPSKNVVALVSFPGSGNTWLRYLLQQVTGIFTGSIYMDHGLRVNGFPAENVTDGSVLVVKTHEMPPANKTKFTSAILLIRNPRDAILADFHRLHKGHIGTAPKAAFKKKSREKMRLDWTVHVSTQLESWENMNLTWLRRFQGPIHIVFYETLVQDTSTSLQEILDFLSFNYTQSDLACAIRNREGIYRRRKKHKDFDPYTTDMYDAIDEVKTKVLVEVSKYRAKHTLSRPHRDA